MGSGSTASDADLMHAALTNHDLRNMLRNTTARPSLPSSHGAIGGGLALLLRSGRPGRPPAVPPAVSRRMRDVLVAAKMMPEPLVVSQGIDKGVSGEIIIPGANTNTCSSNSAPNNTWTSWRSDINRSLSCGVGHTSGTGANAGVTTLTAALSFINNPTPASSWLLWQLNAQNGLAGGKRRKFQFWTVSNVRPRLRQVPGVQEPGVPTGASPAGPGNSSGPGGSVGVERHWSTSPRARRRPRLRGYEVPAVQYEVVPGAAGAPPRVTKPVRVVHRLVRTKEKKTFPKVGALLGAYHKLTELFDLFDAFADAIPGKPCKGLPGFGKMLCVLAHWDEIDPLQAAKNIIANEIEDRVVASLQGRLADALQAAGGPNATQVNQFLRQLRAYQP